MLKENVLVIYIIIFILLISCGSENKEIYITVCKDYSSPNFKTIFMDLTIDTNEILIDKTKKEYGEYYYEPNRVAIHHNINIEDIIYSKDNLLTCPVTFKIEIEKNKNAILQEELYKKMFYGWQSADVFDYIPANIWSVDDNCNDLQKIYVPFYKYKETDSSYILTTQLIENDVFVAGYPIFFVDNKTIIKTRCLRSYDRNGIILLPVDVNVDVDVIAPAHIKAEIDLVKYENNSYLEYKDTLEMFIDVFMVALFNSY